MAQPRKQEDGDMPLPPRYDYGSVTLLPKPGNDNVARPPRVENDNVALPSRQELPPGDESGNVALPTRQELPPGEESGNTDQPPSQDNSNMGLPWSWLPRVLRFVHKWLKEHMWMDCQEHGVMPHGLTYYVPVPLYNYQGPDPWPLYFQREEMINHKPYLMQLEKMPVSYYLQTFLVRRAPLLNNQFGIILYEYYLTIPNGRGLTLYDYYCPDVAFRADYMCGVYRVMCRVSHEYRYLISYEITRVASLHYI